MSLRATPLVLLALGCFAPAAPSYAQELYVPNYLDGDVSVLDAETLVTLDRIPVTARADPSIPVLGEPSAVEFSLDHKYAFVVISNSDRVAVIDTGLRDVIEYIVIAPVTNDALIFLNPQGNRLYVTSCADPVVSVIDVNSRLTIGTIPLPAGSYPMAFSPTGRTGYLGNGYTGCGEPNGLHRIDLVTNTLAGFIPTSEPVSDIAVAPNGLFALTTGGEQVLVVNLRTNTQTGAIRCGNQPCVHGWTGGIVFNAEGTRAYTVDAVTNEFITINTDPRSRLYLHELSRVPVQQLGDATLWQVVVRRNLAYVIGTNWLGPAVVVQLDVSRDVPRTLRSGQAGTFAYELDIWPEPASQARCDRDGWKDFGFKNRGQCVSSVVSRDPHSHWWRR